MMSHTLGRPSFDVEERKVESRLKSKSLNELWVLGWSSKTCKLGHSKMWRCPSSPPVASLDPSALNARKFWGPISCIGDKTISDTFSFEFPSNSKNLLGVEEMKLFWFLLKLWWIFVFEALCATHKPSALRLLDVLCQGKNALWKILMCVMSCICTAPAPNTPRTQLQCTVPVLNHDFVPPHLYLTFYDVFHAQIGCKNNGITSYNWELDFFFVQTHFCKVLASALFTF